MNAKLMICLVATQMLIGCGKDGADGADGVNGALIKSMHRCSKIQTGLGIILLFTYESTIFTTGDRLVNCAIAANSGTFTRSSIYHNTMLGSTSGHCTVGLDIDTASGGYWNFTSPIGDSTVVVYNDSGSPDDDYSFTFDSSDCTEFNF